MISQRVIFDPRLFNWPKSPHRLGLTRIPTGISLTKQPASLMYQCKLHSAHSSQQTGNLPEHIFYGYDHNSTESQQHLSNEDHQNNSQNNNRVTGPKVIFKKQLVTSSKVFSFLHYYYSPCYSLSYFHISWSLSMLVTPPIAEIICVKNGRAIVVCGFLMK